MARYEAGETLASIARTYDCSPPAISYVVSRSRAQQPGLEMPPPAPSAAAAQLIKTAASDPPPHGNGQTPPAAAPRPNGRDAMQPREGNGFDRDDPGDRNGNPPGPAPRAAPPTPRPPAAPLQHGPANGDQRRTLHLSLGHSSQGNGGTHPADHHPAERYGFPGDGHHPQPQAAGEPVAAPANPASHDSPALANRDRERDFRQPPGLSEPRASADHPPLARPDGDPAPRRDNGGAYIDKDLRSRVDGDIAAFLAAFDAALEQDTQDSRSALREATDRLLRAGARTRIELERLEARMPLPPRDNIGRPEAWRHR